jgi:hypothetical protein
MTPRELNKFIKEFREKAAEISIVNKSLLENIEKVMDHRICLMKDKLIEDYESANDELDDVLSGLNNANLLICEALGVYKK